MPFKLPEKENAAARRRYATDPKPALKRCAEYRASNAKVIKERDRARSQRPDRQAQRRASTKRWQEANREKARASSQKWRAANIEKRKEYERQARLANPEKYREKNRRWINKNAEAYAAKKRAYRLQKEFGLTATAYDALLIAQGGVCAICKSPPKRMRLAVDHSHAASRKVRGLLCSCCNTAIGKLRESPDLLRAAIDYLERHA